VKDSLAAGRGVPPGSLRKPIPIGHRLRIALAGRQAWLRPVLATIGACAEVLFRYNPRDLVQEPYVVIT
jgi:hypothetical protein